MDIVNFTTLKGSINESFKINTNLFISTNRTTYRKKLDFANKMFYRSTLVARNAREIVEIEGWLLKNITKLIVQPIHSTMTRHTITENTNIVNGDFYEPFTIKGDYLLYGNSISNLQKIGIASIDSIGNITLENNIDLNEGDMIMCGKVMTLSKKVSINKTSNTYWKFSVSCEEL